MVGDARTQSNLVGHCLLGLTRSHTVALVGPGRSRSDTVEIGRTRWDKVEFGRTLSDNVE